MKRVGSFARIISFLYLCAVGPLLAQTPNQPPIPTVKVVVAFPNLKFDRPLYITHPRDGTDRLFVVEQAGRVF